MSQATLDRNPDRREVAETARDGRHAVCPDCGQRVGRSKSGGKPLPDTDAECFGWSCEDCNLTLPSNCHGPSAPHYNDRMRGLAVEFRGATERFVPVPKRYVEAEP
jgi:hypothetical protein